MEVGMTETEQVAWTIYEHGLKGEDDLWSHEDPEQGSQSAAIPRSFTVYIHALEATVSRLKEALRQIGDNALVDDPCWAARYALGEFDFADLPSAPAWFKEAAVLNPTEES